MVVDRAVTPYPDGLDVHARQVGDGRHVAVVCRPWPRGPGNTYGRVFERLSGKQYEAARSRTVRRWLVIAVRRNRARLFPLGDDVGTFTGVKDRK